MPRPAAAKTAAITRTTKIGLQRAPLRARLLSNRRETARASRSVAVVAASASPSSLGETAASPDCCCRWRCCCCCCGRCSPRMGGAVEEVFLFEPSSWGPSRCRRRRPCRRRFLRKIRGTLLLTEEAAAIFKSDMTADLTNAPSSDRMKSTDRSKGGRLPSATACRREFLQSTANWLVITNELVLYKKKVSHVHETTNSRNKHQTFTHKPLEQWRRCRSVGLKDAVVDKDCFPCLPCFSHLTKRSKELSPRRPLEPHRFRTARVFPRCFRA